MPFQIYEDSKVDTYLELISGEERGRGAAAEVAEGGSMGGEAPEEGNMETN